LDIRLNQLGDTGAQYLQSLRGLRTLDISENQLGDTGAQYFQYVNVLRT
jgi:hypothetical protein